MKKLLIVGLMLLPVGAFASTSVTSVLLNGNPTATVTPGSSVSVEVHTTLTSNDDWESTFADWITDGVGGVCFNTSDKLVSGNHTNTFSFTAPGVDGVYDLNIAAHGSNGGDDDTCSTSADDTTLFADVLTVQTPAPTSTPATSTPSVSDPQPEFNGSSHGKGGKTAFHPVDLGDGTQYCPWLKVVQPLGSFCGQTGFGASVVANETIIKNLQFQVIDLLKKLIEAYS